MAEFTYVIVFVTAVVASFASIPLVLRLASAYGLYDQPDSALSGSSGVGRRIHKQPIPRLGGIGLIAGFFISMLSWVSPFPLQSTYACSLVLFSVGVIDDIRPLSARLRLILQLSVSSFAVFAADLGLNQIALTHLVFLPLPSWLGYVVSVFVLVGAINAINMVDGLDGLAGGLVLIAVFLLSLLHYLTTGDSQAFLCLSLPLIGSIIGFLRYNTHPATVFMGDGGSTWLGFMVGILVLIALKNEAIGGSQAFDTGIIYTGIPFISAILCLAVPIVDTAMVISRRLLLGQNPMTADRKHFHHLLLDLGLSHSQSVSAIYFIGMIAGILGLLPVVYTGLGLIWIAYLGSFVLFLFVILAIRQRNFIGFVSRSVSSMRQEVGLNSVRHKWLFDTLEALIRYILYGIFALTPLIAGALPRSYGYAALGGVLLLVIGRIGKAAGDFFRSIIVCLCAGILLTLVNVNELILEVSGIRYSVQMVYNSIFIALFFVSVAYFLINLTRRALVITPSDFLILVVPLILLLVPEPYLSILRFKTISLRAFVVFFSVRLLVRRRKESIRRLSLVLGFGLVFLVLVGLLNVRLVY